MKKFLSLVTILFLMNCSNNGEPVLVYNNIVGRWQVVEIMDDIITEEEVTIGNQWEIVEDGDVTEFFFNGTFENLFLDCPTGEYTLEDHNLYFTCAAGESSVYDYEFEENYENLIISTGFISKKYVRID